MEHMYANKYSVTINEQEAIISFQWVSPVVDDEGNVTGVNVVAEKSIVMARAAYDNMLKLMNGLDGAKPEQK